MKNPESVADCGNQCSISSGPYSPDPSPGEQKPPRQQQQQQQQWGNQQRTVIGLSMGLWYRVVHLGSSSLFWRKLSATCWKTELQIIRHFQHHILQSCLQTGNKRNILWGCFCDTCKVRIHRKQGNWNIMYYIILYFNTMYTHCSGEKQITRVEMITPCGLLTRTVPLNNPTSWIMYLDSNYMQLAFRAFWFIAGPARGLGPGYKHELPHNNSPWI